MESSLAQADTQKQWSVASCRWPVTGGR